MGNYKFGSMGACALPLLLVANTAFSGNSQASYESTLSYGDVANSFTLNVPFDQIVDDQYLYLFPETFEIQEDRSSSFTSGLKRSNRFELQSGAYFEYGAYARFYSSSGQVTLHYEQYTPQIRDYMQVRFREEALERYYRATEGYTGYGDPSQFEDELVQVLDRVFDFFVDENARIQTIDRPDYEARLAALSEEERAVLDRYVDVDEVIAKLEKIRARANFELEALPDIDDLEAYRSRNITTYDLEAGVHMEYGQLYETKGFFDMAGWFVSAELGAGITVYDVEDEGLFGCAGPRGRIKAGLQLVTEDRASMRAGVASELPFTQHCVGGVTRETEVEPTLFIEAHIPLGNQATYSGFSERPSLPADYRQQIRDSVAVVNAHRGRGFGS